MSAFFTHYKGKLGGHFDILWRSFDEQLMSTRFFKIFYPPLTLLQKNVHWTLILKAPLALSNKNMHFRLLKTDRARPKPAFLRFFLFSLLHYLPTCTRNARTSLIAYTGSATPRNVSRAQCLCQIHENLLKKYRKTKTVSTTVVVL